MFRRKKSAASGPKKPGTLSQLRSAYIATRETDKRVGPYTFGLLLGALLLFALIGLAVHHVWLVLAIGVPLAILASAIFFGKRAERAAYGKIAGQPGAAAAVLGSFQRGGWIITPGVAVSRQQDLVHRAIGRAGIVLVGEGAPDRVGTLISQERKRIGRIVPDVPIRDLQAGDQQGQTPLGKLQRELMRLPKTMTQAQAVETDKRLKAVGSLAMPMPKGPLGRQPRAPRGMR